MVCAYSGCEVWATERERERERNMGKLCNNPKEGKKSPRMVMVCTYLHER